MNTPTRNKMRGRRTQKTIADRIGAENVGLASLNGEDLRDSVFSYEVKNRVKSTAHNFMQQAVSNCPTGKMPVVIIHKHKDRHSDDLVCMRLSDWESWNGAIRDQAGTK